MKAFPIIFSIILAVSAPTGALRANDSVRPKLEFRGIEDPLLENVRRNVRLATRLQDPSPITTGEMRRLQRRVTNEIKQALQPYGYYNPTVRKDSSESTDTLVYQIELNAPVRINTLNLSLPEPGQQQIEFANWRETYPLQVGDILVQPVYDAQKKSLLSTALRLGYFDARFTEHKITINAQRTQADIALVFDSGIRYKVGNISLIWSTEQRIRQKIDDDVLMPLITTTPGKDYDADALSKTQRELAGTGYFSSVNVQTGDPNSTTGEVPIDIILTPSKSRVYHAEVGAGTDTGLRGGIGFENRRLNRKGHSLNLRLGGSEIKRSAIINYRVPLPRDKLDSLNYFGSLEEEIGDTRQYQLTQLGTELSVAWNDALLNFGLTASREKYTRLNQLSIAQEQTTDLLMPSIEWSRTVRDDLYYPTQGWSASILLRGADQRLASDIDLAQIIIDAKSLHSIGNGKIKTRVKLAGSLIDEAVSLPESLGFLAGGDDSIRGYRYESIGVERNGVTTVGKNLVVGSLEYQHPIKSNLAWATFIDAGDVFDGHARYKKGAGIGLRWRLPFGALRLDLASALDRAGDPVRVHFSFGTDL
ncbi:outer membrane protein assembly factor [Arenicella chitinivorans]|uniref:Translocation and assembly module subunit TamA n=1 Tax=Arenicella chitinivorans TaxID=1329800 RepID=A0A918RY12_9GAMM|nr:autotransporter assembly complex family protein [Arenicella chitinivorans]GHA13299.1 outer membrane protein assembly factor [Arenicella chitinivorans]